MPEQPKPFHELFREHLAAGTQATQRAGDLRPPRWKNDNVASEVGCTSRTVTNWKNGNRTPTKDEFVRIVALLFGDNKLHAEAKAAFVAAWELADRQRKSPPGGKPASAVPASQRQPAPPTASTAAWQPRESYVLRDGLARLYVHQTGNQADAPGSVVALEVTVDTGRTWECIPKSRGAAQFAATFAVTRATLVVVRELNAAPVRHTELGSRGHPHPNVTFAGAWELKVPMAADGMPGGNLLAQETLRQYATRDGLPYGIRLELRCRDIDLKPIDHPTHPDINDKQRAMLLRLLQRQDADPESGVVTLAAAELYRAVEP